jgi:hypothetical protein
MGKWIGNRLIYLLLLSTVIVISFSYFLFNSSFQKTVATNRNTLTPTGQEKYKAPGDKFSQAVKVLEEKAEIKIIEKASQNAGRTPFFTSENETGNVVTLSLRESFPEDSHTTRIETFKVDTFSYEIMVYDAISDKYLTYDEWKVTVSKRFQ